MTTHKYLTKSLFSKAVKCPTKLYYSKKTDYPDKSLENVFLESLAKGGFQVGELAKCYYPGGVMIEEKDYETALTRTNELLERESVIIYEAAFSYRDFFIRTDILVKEGNNIDLIEVKSKSYNSESDKFIGTKGTFASEWKPYIYDVAFQKYVLSKAYPEYELKTYLYLADKSSRASVDGLNQKFFIKKNNGRVEVITNGNVDLESLGEKILTLVNVDNEIQLVWDNYSNEDFMNLSFTDFIDSLATNFTKDEKISLPVGKRCKSCEYKANDEEISRGKKSGFIECWHKILDRNTGQSEETILYNIWNLRKIDEYFGEGKFFISQVDTSIFDEKKKKGTLGLTTKERQKLQYESVLDIQSNEYFDKDGVQSEMRKWKFPLHFIDFETSIVAIPFNKNMRPYELIAFQYSHHVVYEDGRIEHSGQYINTEQGKFPNFEFLRNLKNELENDDGTIFRYAAHEKTVLNSIKKELENSDLVTMPDKDDLIQWISEVTDGKRAMVDMLDLIKKYYYSPLMKGSNSLKVVLPAILNHSSFLQEKYIAPIYGTVEMPSLNFDNPVIWIQEKDSVFIDPYHLLPKIEYDLSDEEVELLFEGDGIAEGGAAMIAYNQMQFSEMSEVEKESLTNSLLKYCELDTFAMVLLWEFFKHKCL